MLLKELCLPPASFVMGLVFCDETIILRCDAPPVLECITPVSTLSFCLGAEFWWTSADLRMVAGDTRVASGVGGG